MQHLNTTHVEHLNLRLLFLWAIVALIWLLLVANIASAQTPPPDNDNVVLSGHLNCPPAEVATGPCAFGLHYVDLVGGRVYEIRMQSTDFPTRLMLEDLQGNLLAADTDFYDRLNGCIVFRAPATDSYRLIADSTTSMRAGEYTITVRELPVIMQREGAVSEATRCRWTWNSSPAGATSSIWRGAGSTRSFGS